MSRIRRAWDALTGGDAAPGEVMATVVTSPRNRGDVGPYQTPNLDKPIASSRAPPGARQQWQLYRAREASRDLELTSPMFGGYVRFVRIQCLGGDPARLQFDRLTREQTARLEEPIRYLRRQWARFQMMRDVGGTGRSIHQMAGSALHHVDVDGDCFLMNRGPPGRRVWDLLPGDALAEGQFRIGSGLGVNGGNRQLGIETDGYGHPVAYYFRNGGRIAALNVEHSSFGGQGGSAVGVPARRVQHIRDLSGEVTAVRGWPRCTPVVEDIARLDDWYSALVRGAITRAAIGLALKRSDGVLGAADTFGAPDDMGAAPPDGEAARERLPRYQEFARNAGTVLEMDPGWEVQNIQSPAPTAQESAAIGMLERRVCAALRTSPATLLGDYKALSFSGGQLAHLQEKQAIEDRQMMLASQFYAPIYKDWLGARWLEFVAMFPAVSPADLDALLYPQFRLRKYQVIDPAKSTKPILERWEAGLITYAEARESLGHVGVDVDATIAEWKEDRAKLGLPETPSEGGGMSEPPGAEKDDDDESDEDEEDADG